MQEIVMDGPGKNALGSEMMRFLIDRLSAAGGEPVLLTGSKTVFSAGLNLKEVGSLNLEQMEVFLDLLETCVQKLFTYPGPTVAAVNGHAIAGGCVLTLACDWRVCTNNEKVKVGLNELALGVPFPPGILKICQHRIPPQHYREVILGAQLNDPMTALGLGIVDELAVKPIDVARERIEVLAGHNPRTYAMTKRFLQRNVAGITAEEAATFRKEAQPLWVSDKLKAQIAAMFRK